MIIWLASYPKSGNTLVRSMLSAYFFSKDGICNFDIVKNIKHFPTLELFEKLNIDPNKNNEIIKNYIKVQNAINDKNSIQFMKTHSYLFNFDNKYPFTNLDISLGVIYIVRDPRNVVSSLSNHINLNIKEAFEYMKKENNSFSYKRDGRYLAFVPLLSWILHQKSWINVKKFPVLTIKYEDLELKTYETFKKVLLFIGPLIIFLILYFLTILNEVLKHFSM